MGLRKWDLFLGVINDFPRLSFVKLAVLRLLLPII